jgi:hypothetical protein
MWKFGDEVRYPVTVDEFRVPKGRQFRAEFIFYELGMHPNLLEEFLFIKDAGKGVVIGLTDELYSTMLSKVAEALQNVWAPPPRLLDERTCDTEGHLEPAFIPVYKVEKQTVGRDVTLVGDFVQDSSIQIIIEVVVLFPNIQDSIGS